MLQNSITRTIITLLISLVTTTHGISQNKKNKRATSKEVASFAFKNESDRKKFEAEYFKSQRLKIEEEWIEEIESLEACLEISDKIPSIHFEMGLAQLKSDQKDLAVNSFKKAVELDGKNTWYSIYLANAYRSIFSYSEEMKIRKQLSQLEPENLNFRQSLIESLLLNSKHKEAIEQFNILERNYGIQAEYSFQKHQLYTTLKNWKAAEKEILILIEEFPTEFSYQLGLAEYYTIQKNRKKAIATYQKVLEASPNNGGAEFGLFQLYFQNDEIEKAEKYLKSALQSDDLTQKEQLRIVEFAYSQYSQNKRSKEDLTEILELAIEKYPNQFEYYGYLGDLQPITNYKKKLEYYKKGVKLKPLYELYRVICEVYYINKEYDSTIVWSNNTIENFEYNTQPYLLKGYSHLSLEQYDLAINSAKTGLEYVLDKAVEKIPFLEILGSSYHNEKNYKESDKAYESILKIDPENIGAKNNYSYYLSLREEKLDLAEKMIKDVIELEPNNSTYLDTYGWVLFKQKNFTKALDVLLKAIKFEAKPSSDMLEHLGDCYFELKDVSKALENWKKAKKALNGTPNKELDKKIEANE